MGKRMCAFITDMNQPLGRAVGNANELIEAIEVLHGRGPADLVEITLTLGAEMLCMAEKAADAGAARALLRAAIADGSAAEKMRRVIAAQGGDPAVVDDYARLPSAAHTAVVTPGRAGYVAAVDTEAVGISAILLGAGRDTVDSPIDHGVGLEIEKRLGDRVEADEPLVTVRYNDGSELDTAVARLRAAFTVASEPVQPPPLVHERLD
jgi:pyrimidine-nucleoside phosphorylase